ncbi:hypothetical protein D3OALGA1CA_5849 [Olavius algarvensis associated proteobacterium Delta 3]|nr:hypothetical protein D3OALGB2SA_1280 [Olavius algarvensis associated proteobacterium Delta 3]CAB5172620.1 hypothetical protein D3OALGA1CA_5849 [Olavius algarvensis associated proteobacterium Delta 3]
MGAHSLDMVLLKRFHAVFGLKVNMSGKYVGSSCHMNSIA